MFRTPRLLSAAAVAVALGTASLVAAPGASAAVAAPTSLTTVHAPSAVTAVTARTVSTKITSQPRGASVRGGAKVTLRVKAKGTKLAYQWYVKAPGKKSFAAIKKATKASYTTPAAANKTASFQYRVLVKGKRGKVTSKVATVKVKAWAGTKITGHPASASIRGAATAKFSVRASGESLKYQWQVKAPGKSSFASIKGATKSSYVTPKQANKTATSQYRVLVAGKGGKATSRTATLKVTAWAKPTISATAAYRVEHASKARVTVSGRHFNGTTVTVSSATSQTPVMKLVARTDTTLTFEVTKAGYVDVNVVSVSNPGGSATADFLLMAKASAAAHQSNVDWVIDLSDEDTYGPWHVNIRTEALYASAAIRENVNRWAVIDDTAVELLDAAIDYEDAAPGSDAELIAWYAVQDAYEALVAFLEA